MGEPGRGADMIAFEEDGTSDVECGDENAENAQPTALLARGNAQVRDGDGSNPPQSQQASGLSFLEPVIRRKPAVMSAPGNARGAHLLAARAVLAQPA